MPCPKCKGVLTRDGGVVYCAECFHVLNKEERDQCFGAGREIETNQSIKKEIVEKKVKINRRKVTIVRKIDKLNILSKGMYNG